MYADDLKIYLMVKSLDDWDLLQDDIDNVVEWSQLNKMKLNFNKCEFLSFYGGSRVNTFYNVGGVSLKRNNEIKDLGVTFNYKLDFSLHVSNIASAAMKSLGQVLRICNSFQNPQTFKLLYNALVKSKLTFSSVTWNNLSQESTDQIEKVQKRFLRYLYFRKHNIYPHYKLHPVSSKDLLHEFQLVPLKDVRENQDIIFLFKILNGDVDCPELLQEVYFRINVKNTRSQDLLISRSKRPTANILLDRLISCFNEYSDIDPFADSTNYIKNKLKNKLKCNLPKCQCKHRTN